MNKKELFVVGLVTIVLIAMIGMAVARPTAHLGGDINDGVTLQGRNLPEATLGIGPQPETTLGIGPQEEVTIWEQRITTRPTAHLGGDINDGVTLQGRNLPEATLGIGPQPETTLGIGPQEENVIGGEVVTEEELAEKIAAIAEIELPRAEHNVPFSYGEHDAEPDFSYGEHDITFPASWERER